MNRDKALRALQEGLKEALGYHGPVLFARENMSEIIAALSSPCDICGGRKPRGKARGDVWVWPTGPPYLYRIESGNLELVPGLGADAGGQRQRVDILILDVLPTEEPA